MDTTRMIIAVVIIVGVIYYISIQPKEDVKDNDKKTTETTAPPIPPLEGMYTTYDTANPTTVKDGTSKVWQVFRADSDGKITDLQNTMTLYKDSTIKTTIPSDVIQLRDLNYNGNSWSATIIQTGKPFGPFPLEFRESQNKIMMYLGDGTLLFLLGPVPAATPVPTTTAPGSTTPAPTIQGGLTVPPRTTRAPTTPPPVPPPFYGANRFEYPIMGRFITIYKEHWDPMKKSVDEKTLVFDSNSITTLILSSLEIYGDGDGKSLLSQYAQVFTSGDANKVEKDSNETVLSTTNTLRFFLTPPKETIVKTSLSTGGFGAFVVVDLGSNLEISRVVLKGNFSTDTIFTILADPSPKSYLVDTYTFGACSNKLVTNACKYPYPPGTVLPTLPENIKTETDLKNAATSATASPELKTYYKYWDATNRCKLTCGFDLGRISIAPR